MKEFAFLAAAFAGYSIYETASNFPWCPRDVNRGNEFTVQDQFLFQYLYCFFGQRNVKLSKHLAILERAA